MPRWACRLFLRVEETRVERLQDITEDGAQAEGVLDPLGLEGFPFIEHFRDLWDSINEERGHGWSSNPWVWAVTFSSPEKEDESRVF